MKLKMKLYRFAVIAALCTGVLTACSGGTETSDDVSASGKGRKRAGGTFQ